MCAKVAFTEKAWATQDSLDQVFLHNMIQMLLTKHEITNFLLYLDNLGAYKKLTFVRKLQKLGGEAVYGPENATEGWQPIYAGHIAATIKSSAREFFEQWMEEWNKNVLEKRNFELWRITRFA